MSVQGGVAHAVRNDHIVAVGAGPLGDDDRARLGSVHRTGVTHPADVGALVVGGANAAGGITPAYGGGDIPAVHRPDIAAGVSVVFLSLRRHLFFQLLLHLLDLLLDAALLGLQLLQRGLILGGVVVDLLDQLVGLVPLGAELLFLGLQFCFGGFQRRLIGFQTGFLLRNLRLQGLKVLNHPPVIVHDLVDKVQTAQQVGKAVGLEQHRPIADGAPLLHFPDPLAEQLVLSLLPLLGVRQFGFRLRNKGVVVGDLSLRVADLGVGVGDLVIQKGLFLHRRRLVVLQTVELALDLLLLFIQTGGVPLQGVDIRLGDLGGHSRGHIHRQAQHRAEQRGADADIALAFLHVRPPLHLEEPPDGGKAAAYANEDASPQKYAAHRLPKLLEGHDGKEL